MKPSPDARELFGREVAAGRRLWTIADRGGFAVTKGAENEQRTIPFWSSTAAVARFLAVASAYRGFRPVEITWDEFDKKWRPALIRDSVWVGLNWSGADGAGYDMPVLDLCHLVRVAAEALAAKGNR
jgi:hypothetical protein